MVKKKYKVVKSKNFKEKEKKLPKDVRKELDKVIEILSNNPHNVPNTMTLFGPPSAKELKQWMGRVRFSTIDLVLEYLNDKGCLNKKGRELAHEFWTEYIMEI